MSGDHRKNIFRFSVCLLSRFNSDAVQGIFAPALTHWDEF